MNAQLTLAGIDVDVIFKDIKNVHLSVHPPTGRVRIAAPARMSLETIRAFAATKMAWIKRHQTKQTAQLRESPREYLERESHYLWGRRYLLRLQNTTDVPSVAADHKSIMLCGRDDWDAQRRQDLLEEWFRDTLRAVADARIAHWERVLDVRVNQLFIQRMRTRWGGANPSRRNVRLNTELVHKPRICTDYLVLHEMLHFLVPNHGPRFTALLDRHMPQWQQVRQQLNAAPLSHLTWSY